jgi:hypothetical protein
MSSILTILWIFEGILYHPNILLSHHVLWTCRILVIPSLPISLLVSCRNISQMASAIQQSQQWSICCHCGWFHQSNHVSHEISSISQRQSIRQRSGEGKLQLRVVWSSNQRFKNYGCSTTLWQRCQELQNFAFTCST